MNTDELESADLKEIEYLLKKDLARRMGAIQEDRITGPTDRNVGNASDYVKKARVLRKILEAEGRQGYVSLRNIHTAAEWLDDDVMDAADIDEHASLDVVVERLHSISHPHFDAGTMTDHDSVPGRPSA